jgi:hypothetical protein
LETRRPTERPTAGQIVEQVQALPNQVVDRRPIDKFHSPFPSATIYDVQSFPQHHAPFPTSPHQYPYSEYAGIRSSESVTAQFGWQPPATRSLDLLVCPFIWNSTGIGLTNHLCSRTLSGNIGGGKICHTCVPLRGLRDFLFHSVCTSLIPAAIAVGMLRKLS